MKSPDIEAADFISSNSASLIAEIMGSVPGTPAGHGDISQSMTTGAAKFTLSYLSDALAASSPAVFEEGVTWARVHLEKVGIPLEDLAKNLRRIRSVLEARLPADLAAAALPFLDRSLDMLPGLPTDVPTFLGDDALQQLARDYLQALLSLDNRSAGRLVMDAFERGVPIKEIYLGVFQRTQLEIGRLWQLNEITVAQEHYCTAATQLIMSQFYPYIFTSEKTGMKLVATCVEGELHEVGIRMIADFFEMEGWDTTYLGANTPAKSIVDLMNGLKPDILAISATMPFHVRLASELVAEIRNSATAETRILVGGYAFNAVSDLWKRVGADASARDAEGALSIATKLVSRG